MLKDSFKQFIEQSLTQKLKTPCSVLSLQPVGGGCINESYQLKAADEDFFIKWNEKNRYPGMFEAEAKGLMLLRKANAVYIPNVIMQSEFENISFIILEWIESGKRIKNFWADFGEALANLHRQSNTYYGLEHDNYIGSLVQSNKKHKTWKDFFIEERLLPQLKMALKAKQFDDSVTGLFEKLFLKLDELIPKEQPSLLHGDLWNGNYLINSSGHAALIDPAVYYGHREMDLAMTKLFGGFDEEFYSAYQNAFPPQPGLHQRVDVCNLYPLLVHVNLFGGSYAGQVKRILERFS